GFLGRFAAAGFLDGDLRDEVAPLAYCRLCFFFTRGVDNVLDLLAGRVHCLELKNWHRRTPALSLRAVFFVCPRDGSPWALGRCCYDCLSFKDCFADDFF